MADNIVAAVSRFLTPELVGKLATASGLDKTLAHEGVTAAVPAILSVLAGVASKPDGARQLDFRDCTAIARHVAISHERARRPHATACREG